MKKYGALIKKKSRACVLLCIIFFLSACGSQDQDNAVHDKNEKAEAYSISKLTFGYQPSTHQIAYMTAKDKGWWQDELALLGVKEIREKVFPTGAPEMQAMLTGQIDVAYVGAAPFITALSQGLDAKIIAAVQIQGSDLVLSSEYEYSKPMDIKGFTIATFPPGTIQDTLLREWLLQNGLDPDKDVDIRGMGPGDAISAIASKNVHAVFLPHPAPAIIEIEGNGRSIVTSGHMKPNHACCVLVAEGRLIRDHPALIKKIVKTHIRATRYNQENQDEAARIFSDRTSLELEKVKKSLRDWDGLWLADPDAVADSTVEYAGVQKKLGYIDKSLSKQDIFNTDFYRSVINKED